MEVIVLIGQPAMPPTDHFAAALSPSPRRRARGLAVAALLAVCCAHAEPLVVTQERLNARATQMYGERLATLDAAHGLDADAAFAARVRRLARELIDQAARDYPATANWAWEVHTSADVEQDADCMAGGKILVGQPYAERLQLNDAELAMLLAHEIAHAALRHNLQEYEQAQQLDARWRQRPFAELEDAIDHDAALMARLAPLNSAQEGEADQAGMLLAVRAGWPAPRLANYFRKMMRASAWPNRETVSHPAPSQRWHAAQRQAMALAPPPAGAGR